MVLLLSSALSQDAPEKCSTWRNFDRLKQTMTGERSQQAVARPVNDTSILSPKGLFRIHFDVSGTDAPSLVTADGTPIPNSGRAYAESLAVIFDEVYAIEIEQFGFSAPPNDGTAGGGGEYDVYVKNLGTGNYGYTDWDEDNNLTPGKTNPQFPSFVVIDNNFEKGYYTTGLNAARVTAAHEFHHMIEVSTAGIWYDDFYFYEMCATGLESTVYPEIKDYLQYVRTYFYNTAHWPLFVQTSKSGYERGIFAKYLMEKSGVQIMNSIWKEVKFNRPVRALQNALNAAATSLEREYAEFSIWCYYGNYRADSTKYFKDAALLPLIRNYSSDSISTTTSVNRQASMKAFTTHYHRVLSKQTGIDTVDFIIANTNVADALSGTGTSHPYSLHISPVQLSGYQTLSENIFSKFSAADASNWNNVALFRGGVVPKTGIDIFPNPYNPSSSSLLISLKGTGGISGTTLSIISAANQDVIYSGPAEYTVYSGTQYAEWKGRDNRGNIVGSGIYMFVLSNGSSILKGKFAVIR